MATVSVGVIEAVLRLRDELSQQLRQAAGRIGDVGESLQKTGTKVREVGGNLTTGITLPLTAAAAATLKFSTGFETAITKVGVLTDIGAENIEGMRKSVLEMSSEVAVGPQALAEALLVVASTGIKGADALDVLRNSAKASATGLGEAKEIARSVTAAMTAYGKENLNAAEATNKLFVAVRLGGAEADEFAGSLGRVIGISAQLGVSFDEVLASIATFTRLGVDADEAVTALRGTISTFLKPSKEAKETLVEFGTSIDEVRKSIRERGLQATLTELVELMHGNEDAIGKVIPNVRALAGILGNTGKQAEAYANNVRDIKAGTNEMDDAFKVVSETLGFKFNKALAEAQKTLIKFGDAIAPSFEKALPMIEDILKAVTGLADAFTSLPSSLQTAIVAFGALGAALGPVLYIAGNLMTAFGGLVSFLPKLAALLAPAAATFAALFGPQIIFGVSVAAIVIGIGLVIDKFRELGRVGEETGQKLKQIKLADVGKDAETQLKDSLERANKILRDNLPTSNGPTIADASGKQIQILPDGLVQETKQKAEAIGKSVKAMGDDLQKVFDEISGADAAKELKLLEQAWQHLTPAQKANEQTIKAVVERYSELRDVVGPRLSPALERLFTQNIRLANAQVAIQSSLQDTRDNAIVVAEAYDRYVARVNEANEAAFRNITTVDGQSASTEHYAEALDKLQGKLKEINGVSLTFGQHIKAALVDLPNVILSAITGGGDIGGAIGGLFGGNIGKKIGDVIGKGIGGAIGSAIGSVLPGIGTLLGSIGGGAIGDLFKKLFGPSQHEQVNKLRDAAFKAAGGFDALNEKAALAGTSLQRTLDAKKITDWEAAWESLQGTLAEAEADQQRLNAAIEKYGFQLEELPQKMKQSELDKMAKELIEDWRVLAAAFENTTLVNEKMSAAINDYLQTALRVGAEIPAAMRPILQSMADQGLLVDENGEKITDLEKAGLKFSETMTQGFDRVVAKLDELIKRLQATGQAIQNIPTSVNVEVNERHNRFGEEGASEVGFAHGTRGRYMNFGSGTPVTLHGRERVMTEAEGRREGGVTAAWADAVSALPRMISREVSRAVSDALTLAPSRR